MLKFRSMHADCSAAVHHDFVRRMITGIDVAPTPLDGSDRHIFKVWPDHRVTRVGELIRRLSLDELPQLWNVLRGDMTLVGFRPPIPYEVEYYPEWYHGRFAVKPGITGLWQVSGRNEKLRGDGSLRHRVRRAAELEARPPPAGQDGRRSVGPPRRRLVAASSSVHPRMSQPAVSVIVAAYNSEEGVARLLEALERQTLPREQWELTVADDSSTDETGEVVRRSGLGRVVRTARRGGSYTARNLALEETTAAVIAVTDADCLPAEDWLARGLEQLEAQGADVLGGLIDVPLSDRPPLAEIIDAAGGLDQELYAKELGFVATANAFIRRRVFDGIGGFNPRLISGGDVEFSRRATDAGFKLAYAADVCVHHPPGHAPARYSGSRCVSDSAWDSGATSAGDPSARRATPSFGTSRASGARAAGFRESNG